MDSPSIHILQAKLCVTIHRKFACYSIFQESMIARWITHVFLVLSSGSHDNNKRTMENPSSSSSSPPMLVVFGRPGAGKTTVANAALSKLETMMMKSADSSTTTAALVMKNNLDSVVVGLDLDVCVPQWMKDNFSNGIYPTLEERREFALNACDYVDQQLQEQRGSRRRSQQQQQQTVEKKETTTGDGDCSRLSSPSIISFSFVNTDLRDTFRSRFPNAIWVLVDTDDEEATKRIKERKDHFYKGKDPDGSMTAVTSSDDTSPPEAETEVTSSVADNDNSEWHFAPVTFPHHVLPGKNSVDENANSVVQILLDQFN